MALDYERRDPHRRRPPTFWDSDAGGFVQMVFWLIGFFVVAAILGLTGILR